LIGAAFCRYASKRIMDNPQSTAPSEPQAQVSKPPDKFVAWAARIELSALHRLLIVGALAVFIMFGLFLANYSLNWADWYWSLMFPVFGLVCLGHQLLAGDTHGMPAWKVLVMQALHWLGPIVAVRIIFMQLSPGGAMPADEVALMILLVLAVTCYLAGIHFDRSFVWVSAFLALAALGGTEVEAYFWLLVLIALLAAALVIFSAVLIRRRTTAPAGTA
jgi:hypothetical protein